MRNPENLLSQVLAADPLIAQRAVKTQMYISETDPYISKIGALTERAVGLTVRYGSPLGAENRMNQTPWVSVGSMELTIREASSGGIADHAQVIVREDKQKEMVLFDLGREKIVGVDGVPITCVDATTVIDHIQVNLQTRKVA
jgi:hypothetical protein